MFVLNPDGQPLDGKIYTLDLGDATAEVYVIATNTAHSDTNPEVRRLDRLDHYQPPPRPALSAPVPERAWISAFNNTLPLLRRSSGTNTHPRPWSQTGVAQGDGFTFHDRAAGGTLVGIPATVRSRPATSRSAARLIFFMDSAFFAIPEGPTWEVTDYCPSQVIGVLAHEFQHMIHFYQKRGSARRRQSRPGSTRWLRKWRRT